MRGSGRVGKVEMEMEMEKEVEMEKDREMEREVVVVQQTARGVERSTRRTLTHWEAGWGARAKKIIVRACLRTVREWRIENMEHVAVRASRSSRGRRCM